MKNLRLSRPWFIAIALFALLVCFAALAFLAEPRYQGRSADAWLRRTLSTNAAAQAAAFEVLRSMGPRAEPALVKALNQDTSLSYRLVGHLLHTRLGHGLYRRLSLSLQQSVNNYLLARNPDGLRFAAERVVHSSPSRSVGPTILPLLVASTNQVKRAALLGALLHHLGPDNVTAAQLQPLSITVHDLSANVRLRTVLCLVDAGPCASNQLEDLRQLRTDPNLDLRLAADWALEQLTQDTNPASLLRSTTAEYVEHEGGVLLGWEIYSESYEGARFRMNALMKLVLDSCLTNADAQVRGNACLGLIHHPLDATNDIPILTKLLDDPDPQVRRHAASALTSIRGSGPN